MLLIQNHLIHFHGFRNNNNRKIIKSLRERMHLYYVKLYVYNINK